MSRRQFLKLLGGSTLAAACSPGPLGRTLVAPPTEAGIRAIAFDLFTIFDPRGVDRRVAALLGENAALPATWKTRLFEYCWIRSASGQYVDFEHLVRDSLVYAARAHGVAIADAVRASLEAAFTELAPWPDASTTLRELAARGLRLAPLANYAPRMIEALLDHAGIRDVFEALISTDQARTYKPHPRAYALAEATFGLPRRQIAFAAFGGWDAAGAHWYGYPTFWVNRLGTAPEELVAADATGPDLARLATWVAAH
ncbi:MAG: haloacid dehalogenase type II [Polyangiaceae bacterium]|nr:haloacid dehalogenase type II [Polyangiaceae bacterium]